MAGLGGEPAIGIEIAADAIAEHAELLHAQRRSVLQQHPLDGRLILRAHLRWQGIDLLHDRLGLIHRYRPRLQTVSDMGQPRRNGLAGCGALAGQRARHREPAARLVRGDAHPLLQQRRKFAHAVPARLDLLCHQARAARGSGFELASDELEALADGEGGSAVDGGVVGHRGAGGIERIDRGQYLGAVHLQLLDIGSIEELRVRLTGLHVR